jgi:hypothetical protein
MPIANCQRFEMVLKWIGLSQFLNGPNLSGEREFESVNTGTNSLNVSPMYHRTFSISFSFQKKGGPD